MIQDNRPVRRAAVSRILLWVIAALALATPPSRPWPVEVNVTAETDTTVVVAWHSRDEPGWGCGGPEPEPYDRFELYFMPSGDSAWTLVSRTLDTFASHNPGGRTGTYSVRGWQGTYERWDKSVTGSTLPVPVSATSVAELSTGEPSGFGFRASGYGSGHALMMDSSAVYSADMYLTDFLAGSGGSPLFLASPDYAPNDPGGAVPRSANWRQSWFLAASGSLLLPFGSPGWAKTCSIPTRVAPLRAGWYGQAGYYGFIEVTETRAPARGATVTAWFQSVRGLRLIEH